MENENTTKGVTLMALEMTKEDAIKGIEEASLTTDYWVQDNEQGGCSYCAVGAVLARRFMSIRERAHDWQFVISETARQATRCLYTPSPYSTPTEQDERLRRELSNGNYLGALSVHYEMEARDGASLGQARDSAIKFVEEHFPEKITINVEYGPYGWTNIEELWDEEKEFLEAMQKQPTCPTG